MKTPRLPAAPPEWIDDSAPLESGLPSAPATPSRPFGWIVALLIVAGGGFWLGTRQTASPALVVREAAARHRVTTVQIAGRVKRPGVYRLAEGARVQDAIDRAGGALPDADAEALNLAAPLEDGKKIEVPVRQLTAAFPTRSRLAIARSSIPGSAIAVEPRVTRKRTQPARSPIPTAPKYFGAVSTQPKRAAKSQKTSLNLQTPLDLNRAGESELEALPGIGPALAGRIIAYREENNGFKTIDDLDAVDGIGEKRMETLRPLVVVR